MTSHARRPAWDGPTWRGLEAEGLAAYLLHATEAAAIAVQDHVGMGDPNAADAAAVAAMRAVLEEVPMRGRVVIGEGEKDEAPMLYSGEELGQGTEVAYEIGVDPLEGTKSTARGVEGAVSVICAAPVGALWASEASFYMDKLVAGPAAAGSIDIMAPVEHNLAQVAKAMDKRVDAVVAVVLDKPRHGELIARIRATGASVIAIPDGDVMGALRALLPGAAPGGGAASGADLAMGVGGSPEGVVTACAVKLLGGDMQARLAPQSAAELARVHQEGKDVGAVLSVDDLVASDQCLFVATGVTKGAVLDQPHPVAHAPRPHWKTHSVLVSPRHPGVFVTGSREA